ncbi:hypothetical protein BLNAU_12149 [Blattamonas nauphoetae]|uniref:Uncharacterized protein n=1 Tax=Blattamonas nauphoetae TaxID=2049346 RepID=A0ABQ9XKL7_9EUKA|nr:hypothetical protein BLNAU_18274 [Blattamonas nauphoetae]KAK2952973.1 hypothetical protein BLNAU_12149 [Blattamonas nauphoetae]
MNVLQVDKQDWEIEEDRSLLKIHDPIRKLDDEEDTGIDNLSDLVSPEISKVIHTMPHDINFKLFSSILSQAKDRDKVEIQPRMDNCALITFLSTQDSANVGVLTADIIHNNNKTLHGS